MWRVPLLAMLRSFRRGISTFLNIHWHSSVSLALLVYPVWLCSSGTLSRLGKYPCPSILLVFSTSVYVSTYRLSSSSRWTNLSHLLLPMVGDASVVLSCNFNKRSLRIADLSIKITRQGQKRDSMPDRSTIRQRQRWSWEDQLRRKTWQTSPGSRRASELIRLENDSEIQMRQSLSFDE